MGKKRTGVWFCTLPRCRRKKDDTHTLRCPDCCGWRKPTISREKRDSNTARPVATP